MGLTSILGLGGCTNTQNKQTEQSPQTEVTDTQENVNRKKIPVQEFWKSGITINGKKIVVPCKISDLEKIGWKFPFPLELDTLYTVNPESHYWWGNLDTATYNKLESALREELVKPNFSSRAEDYMKSDAYKMYKAYLCENTDYINLMFQGFLFTEPSAGLCGFLVDDIVKSRYPTAPSIRAMTTETDNQDDEMFAKLNYQKAVWRLMNKEREAKSNKQ